MQVTLLRSLLDDAMIRAREDLTNSKKVALNSYGHGFDAGYLDALQQVYNTINGEDDNVLPEWEK